MLIGWVLRRIALASFDGDEGKVADSVCRNLDQKFGSNGLIAVGEVRCLLVEWTEAEGREVIGDGGRRVGDDWLAERAGQYVGQAAVSESSLLTLTIGTE